MSSSRTEGGPPEPSSDPEERFRLWCGVFAGAGLFVVFGGITVFLVTAAVTQPALYVSHSFGHYAHVNGTAVWMPLGSAVLSLFGLFVVGSALEGLVGPNPLSAITNALWRFVGSLLDSRP